MLKRPAPALRRSLVPLAALLVAAGTADAQTGTVRVARENFRAAPSGVILAEIRSDTELPLGERQDRWREATLEGWIWSGSVREEDVDGHDLVVTASGGENLRAVPNGPIIARLRNGMRLDRVEERDRWLRVRRTGWVWEPSLQVDTGEATPPPLPPGTPAARPATTPAAPPRRPPALELTVIGASGTTVLESPNGDTLARIAPGAGVQVLAREGDWARIRVEGWTFASSLTAGDTAALAVLRDIRADSLAANPDAYRGRHVEWTIQFIALQQAERFRTDFLEGEPFILARGPGEEPGFVYVAVPPERVEEVRRLTPLQRVRVLGRIRTARSPLTGAPVLDLLEMRPLR